MGDFLWCTDKIPPNPWDLIVSPKVGRLVSVVFMVPPRKRPTKFIFNLWGTRDVKCGKKWDTTKIKTARLNSDRVRILRLSSRLHQCHFLVRVQARQVLPVLVRQPHLDQIDIRTSAHLDQIEIRTSFTFYWGIQRFALLVAGLCWFSFFLPVSLILLKLKEDFSSFLRAMEVSNVYFLIFPVDF